MGIEKIAETQRRMYEFIVNYMKTEGLAPTKREIGRELGLASVGYVDMHLEMLEKKGLISLQSQRARGIKLVEQEGLADDKRHSQPSLSESTADTRVYSNESILEALTVAVERLDRISNQVKVHQEDVLIIENKNSNQASTITTEELLQTAHNIVELATQHQEVAYENLKTTSETTHQQLNQIYDQGHNQANNWYLFSIIAALISFLIIIAGAIMTMFFANLSGILTSIAGVIPGTISVLFFQQAKDANKRLDDFYDKLTELEWINKATQLSFTAKNEKQDIYKELIIRRLLRLQD